MSKVTDLKTAINGWLDDIKKISKDGDKIFLEPEGENVLIQILEAEKQLAEVKEEVKAKLAETALKIDPNFSSIQSDKVKVYYREYGSKYYIDETQIDLIPEDLVTPRLSYSVNSKAVEEWVDQHGGMPTGIKEVERVKTLSFTLKQNGQTEE